MHKLKDHASGFASFTPFITYFIFVLQLTMLKVVLPHLNQRHLNGHCYPFNSVVQYISSPCVRLFFVHSP